MISSGSNPHGRIATISPRRRSPGKIVCGVTRQDGAAPEVGGAEASRRGLADLLKAPTTSPADAHASSIPAPIKAGLLRLPRSGWSTAAFALISVNLLSICSFDRQLSTSLLMAHLPATGSLVRPETKPPA